MIHIFNNLKTVYRALQKANSNTHSITALKPSFKPKLLTAVAGHDNKASQDDLGSIPKRWFYGDDACFVSFIDEDCILGVADGVGGWRRYDIDPRQFSRALVSSCLSLVEARHFDIARPISLIQTVYSEILHTKSPILGSATLCLISLCSSSSRLYAASLGDSGFIVLRNGQIVKRSALQKHAFNTPYQLACLPPNNSNVQFHHDPPEHASQTEFDVEIGDILVVGTDGLFDNLTDAMIIQELSIYSENNHFSSITKTSTTICSDHSNEEWLKDCAKRLVNKAKEAATSDNFISPFASEARQYGINIVGGVPGDVTVILGLVVDSSINS